MHKLIESAPRLSRRRHRSARTVGELRRQGHGFAQEQLGNYDAFVMGRVTHENFYAKWGHTSGSLYIDLINAIPKYVASR